MPKAKPQPRFRIRCQGRYFLTIVPAVREKVSESDSRAGQFPRAGQSRYWSGVGSRGGSSQVSTSTTATMWAALMEQVARS